MAVRRVLDWPWTMFLTVPLFAAAAAWFIGESFRHTHKHQSLQVGLWFLAGVIALTIGAEQERKRRLPGVGGTLGGTASTTRNNVAQPAPIPKEQ